MAPECTYNKDMECQFCHNKGHISTVYRRKMWQEKSHKGPKNNHKRDNRVAEAEDSVEEQESYPEYGMYHFQPSGNQPFRAEVAVNKAKLVLEVDTGAALSLISKAAAHLRLDFSQLHNVMLDPFKH